MPIYDYLALDAKNRQRKGIIQADTPKHARQLLREQRLIPTTIKYKSAKDTKGSKNGRMSLWQRLNQPQKKLSNRELISITRQMANLLRASLPVDEVLQTIANHSNANVRRILSEARSMVVEGTSLSKALAAQGVFAEEYSASIAAGEQSGELARVLERMAEDTERRQQFVGKMRTAMIYPASIAIVSVAVVVALLTYVVPQVVEVFVNTNRELPGLTKLMISISDFFRSYGQVLLVLLVGGFVAFRAALRVASFKRRWHNALAGVPVVGKIFIGTNNAFFARNFSLMQSAGVPVLESLRLTASTLNSLPMQEAVMEASEMVREGSSLFRSLQKTKALPAMTLYMLASGESSGQIPKMLDRAAINQEQELEDFTATLLGVVEPLIILVMGGLVLMIVLSVLLPIFEMNQIV
jgi:general secretion pathway protein F